MKVDGRKGATAPAAPTAPAGTAGVAAPPPEEATTDRVTVSHVARTLARLGEGVGDLAAVDQAKVARLTTEIGEQRYSTDFRDVARRLLRELLGELVG